MAKKAIIVVLLVAFTMLGFFIGKGFRSPAEPRIEVKTDTLKIVDTIVVHEPIREEVWVVDSVKIEIRDTLRLRDTLFVVLPREIVRWEDSLSVIWASGVRPSIDSVKYTIPSYYIEMVKVEKQRSRWGIGVQAGLSAGAQGIYPYIGIGVSYNLFSW